MQSSSGQVQLQSQLWSADGVYRNADSITNDGNTFGQSYRQTASGGNYPAIQILNPSGSGVVAFVDAIIVAASTAGLAGILTSSTAFANAPVNVACMRAGQSDGVCKVDGNDQVVFQNGDWIQFRLTAQGTVRVPLEYPIQLGAGQGIAVLSGPANNDLSVSWLLREFS